MKRSLASCQHNLSWRLIIVQHGPIIKIFQIHLSLSCCTNGNTFGLEEHLYFVMTAMTWSPLACVRLCGNFITQPPPSCSHPPPLLPPRARPGPSPLCLRPKQTIFLPSKLFTMTFLFLDQEYRKWRNSLWTNKHLLTARWGLHRCNFHHSRYWC